MAIIKEVRDYIEVGDRVKTNAVGISYKGSLFLQGIVGKKEPEHFYIFHNDSRFIGTWPEEISNFACHSFRGRSYKYSWKVGLNSPAEIYASTLSPTESCEPDCEPVVEETKKYQPTSQEKEALKFLFNSFTNHSNYTNYTNMTETKLSVWSRLSSAIRLLLSADLKVMAKADFLEEDLSLSKEGRRAVFAELLADPTFAAKIAARAQVVLDDKKSEEKE